MGLPACLPPHLRAGLPRPRPRPRPPPGAVRPSGSGTQRREGPEGTLEALGPRALTAAGGVPRRRFLRQNMSKWLDDGTSAPSGRARGKADQFQLVVGKAEIDEDINEILEKTGMVQGGAKRRSHTKFKISG